MLGDSPKCVGIGVRSAIGLRGAAPLFAQVKEFLKGDIVFGNLECVLSDHDYNRFSFKKAQMRGFPDSIKAVREAGFNVLNVANNHIMQHGATGFAATCRTLEKAGIGIVGIRGNKGYVCKPYFVDVGNKRIGFLGYAQETDKYYSDETLYAQGSPEEIVSDVKKIGRVCDYVVVSMHWGDEFVSIPSNSTVNLARKLVDSGAHVIIGHHPHVVQHIETYKNATIIYSLGNFITDMVWDGKLTNGIIAGVGCDNGRSEIDTVYLTNIEPDLSVTVRGCHRPGTVNPVTAPESDDTDNYAAEVNRARIANRNKAYLHVFNNIFKYNILIVLQIVLFATISLFYNFLSNRRSVKA